ncbi:DUF58 domain-containing protein [Psychrobacter sp. I-STPA10]|uniref:DUF58 domain-containing protein n=1 Tax=Psychrobacter sp. I-STPA10 TaxID=2585769 RepID=UPI001E5484B5|nr:DUF58 domain-containing protein [Psychrobacter sp. I-STPA10]
MDKRSPTGATQIPKQSSQRNKPLSLWQRIKQFQPSHYLVKVLLVWWLFVLVFTALQMIYGMTLLTQSLWWLCILAVVAIAMLVLIDWLCLRVISQVNNFTLERFYPHNVPIYHEVEIKVLLTFEADFSNKSSLSSSLLYWLQKTGIARNIQLQFYDSYPDQVTTLIPTAEPSAGQQQVDSMPITMNLNLYDDNYDNDDASSVNNTHGHNHKHIHHRLSIRYPVLPIERGTGYFGVAYLRLSSPFKLLRRQIILTENIAHTPELADKKSAKYLRVLADFSGLLSNKLAAVFEQSAHAGIQSLAQQGHGSDFLKLREYSAGDAIRQIDWKASSRQRRMMSKAYEEDNDQQIVLLLDCGEQMRHQDQSYDIEESRGSDFDTQDTHQQSTQVVGQLNYFDQVLNAALLLAYVANKQGDSIGLMTFGGVERYIPPKKGSTLIRDLLNETADIKPTMQTSDYYTAAHDLRQQLKKRSLVVIISNTRAEASDELRQAIQLLSHQHQVVFANLIEQDLDERLHGDNMPMSFEDALLYHSLTGYEQSRQLLHQYLSQKTGALCLQTTANRLPMRLTQAYLSLKR